MGRMVLKFIGNVRGMKKKLSEAESINRILEFLQKKPNRSKEKYWKLKI